MNNSIKQYFLEAANLIKSNLTLIILAVLIIVCPYLLMYYSNGPFVGLISVLSFFLLVFIYPLIYGRFIYIIIGFKDASWLNIFNEHWLNYTIVKFILYLPVAFLFIVSLAFDYKLDVIKETTSVIIDMLAIYVFPLVFFTQQRIPSIRVGIKLLIDNFIFSLPLIILSILPIVFNILLYNPSGYSEISLFYILSSVPQLLFVIIIDFTVFITAGLILKEEYFKK